MVYVTLYVLYVQVIMYVCTIYKHAVMISIVLSYKAILVYVWLNHNVHALFSTWEINLRSEASVFACPTNIV